MPTSPPSSSLFLLLLHLSNIIFFTLISVVTANHKCAPASRSSSSCPPFISSPPFPFSSSSTPGCGHPSFQLNCSSPHSTIFINNISFTLLHFEPNASSLQLSTTTTTTTTNHSSSSSSSSSSSTTTPTTHTTCSSPFSYIPTRPINLSGTPFRISDSSCSRLSVLRPCSPPNLPNCSHCPWHCKLIKNPSHLLHGCGSAPPRNLLPEQGCQIDVLEYLDSFLKQGFQVEYDESQDPYFTNCKACRSTGAGTSCGFNSSGPQKPFICYRSETKTVNLMKQDSTTDRITFFCSLFAVLFILLVLFLITAVFRSKRFKILATGLDDPTTVFLRRHRSASLLPPVFTYEELHSSTNHFDPARKIGDGGFGCVYLGRLPDGRTVAVKHLHHHHHPSFSTKCFCNEILILSSINHPNLVKLHGYCSDPRGLLLVYDYVTNGTLADHLHGGNRGSLTWQMRLDIALQTALALEYLHFCVQPAVVHRDIKSSNIFVEKDMKVKVGDFGLSRLLVSPDPAAASSGFVWTGPQGTPGYLDPDYHRSFRLTEKSDVYSFGVVLLELVTGMRAVDQRRDKREMALADLVVSKIQTGLLHQVFDPVLMDGKGVVVEGVEAVAELAFRCVAAEKDDRPDAREVVEELKRIRSRGVGFRGLGDSNGRDDVAKG